LTKKLEVRDKNICWTGSAKSTGLSWGDFGWIEETTISEQQRKRPFHKNEKAYFKITCFK